MLMVSCMFPPTGGPGVQRPAKFAKYLPDFGWSPTVWAINRINGMPRDPSLLSDLPDDVMIHARPDSSKARAMRRRIRSLIDTRGVASKFAKAVDWRLEAWLARKPIPDDYVAWAKASVKPLCRLIRKERIDVIYSTSPPHSNQWLALALKRETNLPWVADFRDLFTDNYLYEEASPKRRIAHGRLEEEFLERADVVVGVTDRQTAILSDHVPTLRHKFLTITNGFDPADFSGLQVGQCSDGMRFVLAHVGRFDHRRMNDAWFNGLKRFVTSLGSDRERFMLRIVGHASSETHKKAAATGVASTFTGYISHAEAVREMRSADALLLNIPHGPNGDSVIAAKVFEYLAAQQPILVVGPQGGECEKIVQSCEAGLTVGFDEQAISDALGRLYNAWRAGTPIRGCSKERLDPYSRVALARKLASVLDGLVGRAPRHRTAGQLMKACAR